MEGETGRALADLERRLRRYRSGGVDAVTRHYWACHHELNLALVLKSTTERSVVLDVGCGTGRMLLDLAAQGRTCYGIDPLKEVSLDKARLGAAESGLAVRLVRSNAESLPFRDRQFDLVTFFSSLQHVADQEAAVAEARRVLKPTGRLIVTVPMARHLGTWLRRVPRPSHFTRTFDYPELCAFLAGRGFRVRRAYGSGFFLPKFGLVLRACHALMGEGSLRLILGGCEILARRAPRVSASVLLLCERDDEIH